MNQRQFRKRSWNSVPESLQVPFRSSPHKPKHASITTAGSLNHKASQYFLRYVGRFCYNLYCVPFCHRHFFTSTTAAKVPVSPCYMKRFGTWLLTFKNMSVTHTTFAIQKKTLKSRATIALFKWLQIDTKWTWDFNLAFLNTLHFCLLLFFKTFDEMPCRHRTSSAISSYHYHYTYRSSWIQIFYSIILKKQALVLVPEQVLKVKI